jgi:hypothetical protein
MEGVRVREREDMKRKGREREFKPIDKYKDRQTDR